MSLRPSALHAYERTFGWGQESCIYYLRSLSASNSFWWASLCCFLSSSSYSRCFFRYSLLSVILSLIFSAAFLALCANFILAFSFLISSATSTRASLTKSLCLWSSFALPWSWIALPSIYSVSLICSAFLFLSSCFSTMIAFSLSIAALRSSAALSAAFFRNSTLSFSVSKTFSLISLSIDSFSVERLPRASWTSEWAFSSSDCFFSSSSKLCWCWDSLWAHSSSVRPR